METRRATTTPAAIVAFAFLCSSHQNGVTSIVASGGIQRAGRLQITSGELETIAQQRGDGNIVKRVNSTTASPPFQFRSFT